MIDRIKLWLSGIWARIKKPFLYFCLFGAFIAIIFIGGCVHGRKTKKCPEIITNTILVNDTVTYQIIDHVPYYIVHNDTVIYKETIIQQVDTAAILKDYFAIHVYDRHWQDSLIIVNLKDSISQNKSIGNIFRYKILRPQTIINNTIDNSITYNSYLTFGLGIPIKNVNYINLELDYNWRKGYAGIQYIPELKSFGVKAGVTLLKFKQKK